MLQDMAYGGTQGTELFQQSIAASPYLPMQYGYADFVPSQSYYALAYKVGCFDGTPFLNQSETVLQCLRKKDTLIMQQANAITSQTGKYGTWGFLPVTDGTFVQDLPSRQLQAGKLNGKRILTGYVCCSKLTPVIVLMRSSNNANEGVNFTPQDIMTLDQFIAFVQETLPLFNSTDIENLQQYYYLPDNATTTGSLFATTGDSAPYALDQSSFGTGYQQLADDLYAETTFVCPSYWLVESYSSVPDNTAYKYQFSVPPAFHGADVDGYFAPMSAAYLSPDFGAAFQQIWGNFIMTGDPSISNAVANGLSSYNVTGQANNTPNDASNWTPYSLANPMMLNLNTTGGTPSTFTLNGTDSNPGMPPSPSSTFTINAPDDVYNVTATNGTTTTVTGNSIIQNAIRLVNANTWEDNRYARCEFWRSEGPKVPE